MQFFRFPLYQACSNTYGVLNQKHCSLLCYQFVYNNDWALDLSPSCIYSHSAFHQTQCSNRHAVIWTGCGHHHYCERDLIYVSVSLGDCNAQQHVIPIKFTTLFLDFGSLVHIVLPCVVSPWYPVYTGYVMSQKKSLIRSTL